MGRLKQGILGGVSGKIGNVVGSSWKGIAVVKAMPLSVANPRTAGQIAQRSKMSNIVAFARLILASIIKPLNDRFASGQSGYNAFVSRNIDLFADALPDPYASLTLSTGKMAAVVPSSLVPDRSLNTIVVTWPTTLPDSYAQGTDKVYIACFSDLSDGVAVSSGVVARSAGTATIAMPASWQVGDNVPTWLAFLRADGTVVSNSSFIDNVVIA